MSTQIAGPRLSKDLPHGLTQGSDAPTHKRVGSAQHDPPPNRAGMRAASGQAAVTGSLEQASRANAGAETSGRCSVPRRPGRATTSGTAALHARGGGADGGATTKDLLVRRLPPMRSSGVAPSDYIGALPLSVPSTRRTGSPKSPDYGGCGLSLSGTAAIRNGGTESP
jgi:hypothetical protein